MEGEVIFDRGGNLRPIPKWFTLFSYVVGKRRVLSKKELTVELAGEPLVKGEWVLCLCCFVYFQVRRF